MITDSPVLLVKATHNFKGCNNDELCLKKGDVITVTQAIEGGWWEGTLNGVTGWFPSNYVKEIKSEKPGFVLSTEVAPNLNDIKMYRSIVFQDIVDTESNHLSEMQNLIAKFLNPLKDSVILSEIEHSQLCNNLKDVCACSKALLKMLEDVKSSPSQSQRIGAVFLQFAPIVEKINVKYCSDHPKAAAVIAKHKDALEKFMEEHGASPPGILTLTTGLSKPFRRIEKYPALLQELQRHTQENHVDRGDTQRAATIYKEIATNCYKTRRQKEMELEILTGNVRDWEGEDIHTLGNIIHMGPVVFISDDLQKLDRYLVMFSEMLVILSISSRMSAFIYEGKLPLSGIAIRQLEPSESFQHAFRITGSMIQPLLVSCPSAEVLNQWLNYFQNQNVCCYGPSTNASPKHSLFNNTSPSHSFQSRSSTPGSSMLRSSSPSASAQEDKNSNQSRIAVAARQVTKKVWPNWNLRPHPPLRASLTNSTPGEVKLRRSNSCNKEREKEFGDVVVHHVANSYGTYNRTRNNVPSATASAPPRLNFEEDKIFVEDIDGDIKEKTLVDTVYMLKDQVQELKSEISTLKECLSEEKEARKQLELLVQRHLLYMDNHVLHSLEG